MLGRNTCGIKGMSFARPWSIVIAGTCAVLVLMWFAMSGIQYEGKDEFSSLTSAGWFFLGFPCIVAFGAAYGGLFAFVGRRTRVWIGWLCLLAVTIPLLAATIRQSLPTHRIQSVLGPEASQIAIVESLRESDSFNDGTSTCGILTGPEELLDLIVRHRDLKQDRQIPLTTFQSHFRNDGLPDYGDVYRDARSAFYLHSETGRIYFVIPYRQGR
jgi:hypothetical protein